MAQDGGRTMTFTQAMERLKEIVGILEQNTTELEEGVALYREACACAAVCRTRLDEARNVLEDESLLPAEEPAGAGGGKTRLPESSGTVPGAGPERWDDQVVPF